MLNEARDSVTWWKAQNDHQFLFIYLFIFDINHGYFPTGYPTHLSSQN
jgi:hypothetical protein